MYFPKLSYRNESGLETGDAIQNIPAHCREVERKQDEGKLVCVCVCPYSGWQLSDFFTNKLSEPAWLQREREVTAG